MNMTKVIDGLDVLLYDRDRGENIADIDRYVYFFYLFLGITRQNL